MIGVVAILTYRSAKRGLLNTVNTEYHKKAIEQIQSISKKLHDEFDETSDFHWLKVNWKQEAINRVVEQYLESKNGGYEFEIGGIPETALNKRLDALISETKSDPFLPTVIADSISNYLEERQSISFDIYWEEIEKYKKELGDGKYSTNESLEYSKAIVSNRINKKLYAVGFGVSDVEKRYMNYVLRYENISKASIP